jgi:hypothetical protein
LDNYSGIVNPLLIKQKSWWIINIIFYHYCF